MATLIKTDGTFVEVKPENGKAFTLDELQKFVGGLIDVIVFPSGKSLYINDEGKNIGLPVNWQAQEMVWKKEYPIENYPLNNDETLVGDVLLLSAEEDEAQRAE